jgi:hypothetical protein
MIAMVANTDIVYPGMGSSWDNANWRSGDGLIRRSKRSDLVLRAVIVLIVVSGGIFESLFASFEARRRMKGRMNVIIG